MVCFVVENLIEMNSELKAFADYLRAQSICDEDVFASRLVSCELITNVIRHSGGRATFTGELLPDGISITVTSSNVTEFNFTDGVPDVFAESGRGLYIVRCFGEVQQSGGGLKVYIKRH